MISWVFSSFPPHIRCTSMCVSVGVVHGQCWTGAPARGICGLNSSCHEAPSDTFLLVLPEKGGLNCNNQICRRGIQSKPVCPAAHLFFFYGTFGDDSTDNKRWWIKCEATWYCIINTDQKWELPAQLPSLVLERLISVWQPLHVSEIVCNCNPSSIKWFQSKASKAWHSTCSDMIQWSKADFFFFSCQSERQLSRKCAISCPCQFELHFIMWCGP